MNKVQETIQPKYQEDQAEQNTRDQSHDFHYVFPFPTPGPQTFYDNGLFEDMAECAVQSAMFAYRTTTIVCWAYRISRSDRYPPLVCPRSHLPPQAFCAGSQ